MTHSGRPSATSDSASQVVGQTTGKGADGAARAAGKVISQKERLREAVQPVVADGGYDLEELAVSKAGGRSVVRVVVDGEDGVSSDAIADLSREISAALDAAEAAGSPFSRGGYTLEVSSPGVDRPLTKPRHWRRNRGRLVTVRVDQATHTGRVVAAGDEGVTLDVDGEERDLSYQELGQGKVQIEFGGSTRGESSNHGSKRGSKQGKEEA